MKKKLYMVTASPIDFFVNIGKGEFYSKAEAAEHFMRENWYEIYRNHIRIEVEELEEEEEE